ncbi:MAG: hypothetical protein ABI477_20640 [Chryseolinea sp.]
MKKLIKKLFPGLVIVYNRLYNYIVHYRFKNLAMEQVFATIYKENHWGDNESKSGTGSNAKNAQSVVQIFTKIKSSYSVNTVVDIPCGDFNWMKNVDLNGIMYIGADIVGDLIEGNNKQYGRSNIEFRKLNMIESNIPKADLIFCRDCLVHFSYKDIKKALDAVKASGSLYFVTTTFPSHKNYDIITGDWRPLNLQAAPFNFPTPSFIENEDCMEDDSGKYQDKSLAVWKISDLPYFLDRLSG